MSDKRILKILQARRSCFARSLAAPAVEMIHRALAWRGKIRRPFEKTVLENHTAGDILAANITDTRCKLCNTLLF